VPPSPKAKAAESREGATSALQKKEYELRQGGVESLTAVAGLDMFPIKEDRKQ